MLFILVVASIVTITLLSVNFHKTKKTEIIVEGAVPNIIVEANKSLPPTVVNHIETPPPILNVNNNISGDMEFFAESPPQIDVVEVEEEPEEEQQ